MFGQTMQNKVHWTITGKKSRRNHCRAGALLKTLAGVDEMEAPSCGKEREIGFRGRSTS